MNQVTLDAGLRAKFNGCGTLVELRDERGATVGYFVPKALYGKFLVEWSRHHISDEELERRAQEPGGRSLTEIWQELEREGNRLGTRTSKSPTGCQ